MHTVQTAAVRHYYESAAPSIIAEMWASPWLPEYALRDAMVALELPEELDANLPELERFARHHDLWESEPPYMAELIAEVRAEVAAEWEAELATKPEWMTPHSKEQTAFLAHLTKVGPTKSLKEEGERVAEIRRLFPANETATITPVHQDAHAGVVVDKWQKYLHYDNRDRLLKAVGNVTLILKNADGFKGTLRFNAMAFNIFWHTAPTYKVGIEAPKIGEALSDHHIPYVQHVLLTLFNIEVGKDTVWAALETVAHENSYHPVQDYLNSLTWDGKPRVEKWLHSYMGTDHSPYNSAVGKWWLISAVARALRPGCQADHVLILESKQGKGKSQAIKALGSPPWVLESLPSLQDSSKVIEAIGGKWIVEIAELDALKGSAATRVKDFITQQVDKYRPPYARATTERPRWCAFIGTTNEKSYLNDPTGARRFWPVNLVGEVKVPELKADRDQIWAEAKFLFDQGEQWHPDETNMPAVLEEQEARRAPLLWEEKISEWVAKHKVTRTTADEVLTSCIQKDAALWNKGDAMAVAAVLKILGFGAEKIWDGKKQIRVWSLDNQTT
jgi:hypothetical protein